MVSSLLLDGTSLIDVIQQQKMEFVDRLQSADDFMQNANKAMHATSA
jgi:hypothetical protein